MKLKICSSFSKTWLGSGTAAAAGNVVDVDTGARLLGSRTVETCALIAGNGVVLLRSETGGLCTLAVVGSTAWLGSPVDTEARLRSETNAPGDVVALGSDVWWLGSPITWVTVPGDLVAVETVVVEPLSGVLDVEIDASWTATLGRAVADTTDAVRTCSSVDTTNS